MLADQFEPTRQGVTAVEIVAPEEAGLSSDRLGRLTRWLHEQVSSDRVAGCSVLVSRHGRVVCLETAGYAEVETGKPFERDTLVRIYSMTKPVTTVAAMMLYEEGAFQLDDPVSKYIPAFGDMAVWQGGGLDDTRPAGSPVTVRHLMTHTSGLTYGFMQTNVVDARYRELLDTNQPVVLEEWVDRAAGIPLIAEPGSQWNYSISTDVLGRLVEIWSGLSLDEFFRARVFLPLDMRDTGFFVKPEDHGRFAALYTPENGAGMASVGSTTRTR